MSYCLLSQSLPSTLCSAFCCVLLLGVTVPQGALEEDCNAGGDKDFLIPVCFLLGFYGLPGPVGSTLATLLCSISTNRAVLSLEVPSSKSLKFQSFQSLPLLHSPKDGSCFMQLLSDTVVHLPFQSSSLVTY